jgi:acetyltransferase-like isoleucine patch superfamily enzyme
VLITRLFRNPFDEIQRFFCLAKSIYYTKKYVSGGNGRIVFTDVFLPLKVRMKKSSKLILSGNLVVNSFLEGRSPILIRLDENACLKVDGDFSIGDGVRISLSSEAVLSIKGKQYESNAGITANTLILVNKRVEIGRDFVCSWNVFITDCDWHSISGQKYQQDVFIGDHVWVANSVNILKGSTIGNNCIVASNSKTTNTEFPDNVLIAGVSSVIRRDISWSRDIN